MGIEGVKVELLIPEQVKAREAAVSGVLRFHSMNDQTIKRISVVMIERYARGRKEEKLVDEYKLGAISLEKKIEVKAGEPLEIPFKLSFELEKSEMDEFADKNILYGGLAKMSKWLSKVKSEYRLEAEAEVAGVALNPFDKKTIDVV